MDQSINKKSSQKNAINYLLEVVAGRLVNFGVEEPIGRSERGSCSACVRICKRALLHGLLLRFMECGVICRV